MKPSRRIEMRSRALGRGLLCASVLAMVCLAGSARADTNADSERANLLFKKGKVAFNEGKYTDALRIYSEAWRLKQSPDIAANLAQTEAELGRHRDAAEHFAFALAHLLPSSTDEQKKALAEGLEIEKKEVSTLHVTLEPADSLLAIDDAPVALPPNGEVFVEAGDHHAVVSHEGYETNSQTLHVSKGSAQVLWIKLPEEGAAAPAPPLPPAAPPELDTLPPKLNESSSRSMVPAVVGGGLVVAGAAVGVVFLLSANSSQNDANGVAASLLGKNACGGGTPNTTACATLHDDNKDIDRSRTIEATGFAVAGAAAVGTLLYLLWPHSSDAATARSLTPTFSAAPGIGSLNLSGRF